MVLADGSIVTCSADDPQSGLFDAARVGLGALGVLTAVTFLAEPLFLLTAREEPMRWSELISRLPELISENEHFEFFWFPHSEGCLTKRNNRSPGPAEPLPRWRYWLDDEFLSNSLFGATCRLGYLAPRAIATVNSLASRALSTRTYTDAAYKVFTSPRRVRFKEQEYAIPREHLADVLGEVRALFDSPHEEYFRDTEAIMTAVGGRPHWGKMHTRDAEYLSGVYPRFADFLELRDKLDPDRRFGNAYLQQVLGS